MNKDAMRNEIPKILWGMPYNALKKDDQFTVNRVIDLFEKEKDKSDLELIRRFGESIITKIQEALKENG